MQELTLISAFTIAFLGSFGHCLGMCGGIVLAYSSKLHKNGITNQTRLLLYHLLYNLGRISVYVLLGAVMGAIGAVLSFNVIAQGVLLIVVGLVMFLCGLSLLGKMNFLIQLEKLQFYTQKTKWYQKFFQQALELQSPFSLMLLGILNGFLPCGFVYAFLFSAAGSLSALDGACIMLAFGLGTLLTLFIFGVLANTLLHSKMRQLFMRLAALAILLFATLVLQMGVQMLLAMHTHVVESGCEGHTSVGSNSSLLATN